MLSTIRFEEGQPVAETVTGRRSPLWRLWTALLASVVIATAPISALDPTKDLAQYRHDVWQDKDGLPQNSVRAIVQTRDGYLWLGTYEGLVRFDGIRFTVFDTNNTPALKSSAGQALLEGRDGSLWIGSRRGVTCFKDGVFVAFPFAGLPDDVVWFLFEDHSGAVWVGTEGGALGRIEHGRPRVFGREDGLPASPVSSMTEDRDGNLWIGTLGDGMGLWKDGRFTPYHAKNGRSVNRVTALLAEPTGKIWVGTGGLGLYTPGDGDHELTEIVRRAAHDVFVPMTVGGGIRHVDDVRDLLRAGAVRGC